MNVRLHPRKLCQRAHTLIEVLTAAVIVGVGVSAAVSMATTMTLQQELSWRVSVALNYQENACRLWQLGLGPNDITAVMPDTKGNPFLNEVLDEIQVNKTTITSTSVIANNSTLGTMENATNATQVANFSNGPAGSTTTFNLFRNVTRSSTYEP
jgi:prepilin-type N-terminal cleavage/methylation domain-containing protein